MVWYLWKQHFPTIINSISNELRLENDFSVTGTQFQFIHLNCSRFHYYCYSKYCSCCWSNDAQRYTKLINVHRFQFNNCQMYFFVMSQSHKCIWIEVRRVTLLSEIPLYIFMLYSSFFSFSALFQNLNAIFWIFDAKKGKKCMCKKSFWVFTTFSKKLTKFKKLWELHKTHTHEILSQFEIFWFRFVDEITFMKLSQAKTNPVQLYSILFYFANVGFSFLFIKVVTNWITSCM